jgi:hypothetical protein
MTETFVENDLNALCHFVLRDYMENEVQMYRNKLGYHFNFDFRFMLLRSPSESEKILYGPGIRVREYDLLLKYLWSLSVYDYLDIKNVLYEKYKLEMKKEIESFNTDGYTILVNSDTERDDFLVSMTKYFQIYVIKNINDIVNCFRMYYD